MKHYWLFKSQDATQGYYECANCKQLIGFALPGFGEPSCSPPAVPATIDKYADACIKDMTIEEANSASISTMLALIVKEGIDADKLVQTGKIPAKARDQLFTLAAQYALQNP
jgi:hypothetical protein